MRALGLRGYYPPRVCLAGSFPFLEKPIKSSFRWHRTSNQQKHELAKIGRKRLGTHAGHGAIRAGRLDVQGLAGNRLSAAETT